MLWNTKEDERKRLVYRTVFHCLYLVYITFIAVYGLNYIIASITNEEKKKSVHIANIAEYSAWFGTQWNMMYQYIYFIIAMVYDIIEWRGEHLDKLGQKLKKIRDVHFNGITVPTTFIVFGFFWTLYAYNRELVFSKDLDPYIPVWYNHCLHTLIVPVLIIEAILEPRVSPTDRKLELWLNAALAVIYSIAFYTIYFLTGRWLYALFGVFNWFEIVLFQCFIFILYYLYYIMQFPFSQWIHGDTKQRQNKTEPEHKTEHETEHETGHLNSYVRERESDGSINIKECAEE